MATKHPLAAVFVVRSTCFLALWTSLGGAVAHANAGVAPGPVLLLPHGRYAVGDPAGPIDIYNSKGERVARLDQGPKARPLSMALLPSGELAVAYLSPELILWPMDDPKVKADKQSRQGGITIFSVAHGDIEKTSPHPVRTLTSGPHFQITFLQTIGSDLVVGYDEATPGKAGRVCVVSWNERGDESVTYAGPDRKRNADPVHPVAVAELPNGNRAIGYSSGDVLYYAGPAKGLVKDPIGQHTGPAAVACMTYYARDNYLAVGYRDGTVQLLGQVKPNQIGHYSGPKASAMSLSFPLNNPDLHVVYSDDSWRVFDTALAQRDDSPPVKSGTNAGVGTARFFLEKQLRASFAEYTDNDGVIVGKRFPGPNDLGKGNALLYTAQYLVILKQYGFLNESDLRAYDTYVARCEIQKGLLKRQPGAPDPKTPETPDDYFGVCAASCIATIKGESGQLIRLAAGDRILKYGEEHHWIFNSTNPGSTSVNGETNLLLDFAIQKHLIASMHWGADKDAPNWAGGLLFKAALEAPVVEIDPEKPGWKKIFIGKKGWDHCWLTAQAALVRGSKLEKESANAFLERHAKEFNSGSRIGAASRMYAQSMGATHPLAIWAMD